MQIILDQALAATEMPALIEIISESMPGHLQVLQQTRDLATSGLFLQETFKEKETIC